MKRFFHIVTVICVALMSTLNTTIALAQDATKDTEMDIVTTEIDKGPFYAQLWFWVVIGLVFLLILIALIRGTGGDKQTEENEEEEQ